MSIPKGNTYCIVPAKDWEPKNAEFQKIISIFQKKLKE